MTIEQVKRRVEEERRISSRYPMRMIFCNNISQYSAIVSWLMTSCDLTLNLGEFCGGYDKHPRFNELAKRIKEEKDQHVLLLSVGEYLRLAIARETSTPEHAQFRDFWCEQYSVDSKMRIFMPVFSANELFNRAVGKINERQQDFLWTLEDESIETFNLTVYSDKFASTLGESGATIGFQKWLFHWVEKLNPVNTVLVTARYRDCEKSFGRVSVDVVDSPYHFLCEKENMIKTIPQSSASDENWAHLLSDTIQHNSVDEAILSALNLKSFDSASVVHQWDNYANIERWYAWLWYQLHSPADYAGYIIHNLKPTEFHEVASHIANDIIQHEGNNEWISQRRSIMQGMRNAIPSNEFFDVIDKKIPETALNLLTAQSQEERASIVKTVSRWLRNNSIEGSIPANSMNPMISTVRGIYPEFGHYLETPTNIYGIFTDYFDWYKKHKLINRAITFPELSASLDSLDSRYSILAKYDDMSCTAFWVDGMGIEWMSLICAILDEKKRDTFSYESNYAISRIPSETSFNEQWNDNKFKYVKRNRLDKLSHKGMPDDSDYFLCIATQIQTVSEMINEAIDLLDESEIVIITADHGSSRLAALAFHQFPGTYSPLNAIPKSHGRFCELGNEANAEDLLPNVVQKYFNEKHYLVMTDYEHYKQSGNAAGSNSDENPVAGEIHGGMTPEECIVPVIVLRGKSAQKTIDYWFSVEKLTKRDGKASIEVRFSEPVHSLEIATSDGSCQCTQDSEQWLLSFSELKDTSIEMSLTINGKLHPKKTQLLVSTAGIDKGNMGGLP